MRKIFDKNIYYGKLPHSRNWKIYNYTVDPIDREEQFTKNNVLATTNELLLQKKYREIGIMSAEHIVVPNEKKPKIEKSQNHRLECTADKFRVTVESLHPFAWCLEIYHLRRN